MLSWCLSVHWEMRTRPGSVTAPVPGPVGGGGDAGITP